MAEKKSKKKSMVQIEKEELKRLESLDFKISWAEKIAKQYGFDRMEFAKQFQAFRCYKGDMHVEWISVNDLALLNIQKKIVFNHKSYQPLSKKRQIINLPWS